MWVNHYSREYIAAFHPSLNGRSDEAKPGHGIQEESVRSEDRVSLL